MVDFLKCIVGAALFFVDSEETDALKRKEKKCQFFSLFKFCILLVIVWSGDGIQPGGHLFLPGRQESEGRTPIYVEGTPSRDVMFRLPPTKHATFHYH